MTHPPPSLTEILASLTNARSLLQSDPQALAHLQALRRWQTGRLLRTYADFHAAPRYRDAIDFFAHDLYGPHDYSQRDRDLQRVLTPWQRLLPDAALTALATALELESLSLQLDAAVAEALAGSFSGADVDDSSYAQAYRTAARRDDRQRQIAMIVSCGNALHALVAHPWIGRALRMARVPARLAGVAALHEFLERGYAAFKRMGNPGELLDAIEKRETAVMNNLLLGRADPFQVNSTAPTADIASSTFC